MTATDQERTAPSIDDHHRLAAWNTAVERGLRMTGPYIKNGSGETVITFGDLHLEDRVMGPLPSGYMGFTWSDSAWVTSKVFSSSFGGLAGLLNAHGKDITIESKNLFDLKGLSLCGLWADKTQVSVEGWEKEVRRYATTQTVSRASVIQCALDYRDVDRVELKAGGKHIMVTSITVFIR